MSYIMSERKIKERLKELDEREDIEVNSWEADFIENVLYKQSFEMSARQCCTALDMLEKYGIG